MNSRHVLLISLLVLLLPLAIMLGQWSATDPVMAMSVSAGMVVLAVIVMMQRSIWMLIPLTYAFRFPLTLLPGGFALRDIVAGGVVVVMVCIWMVRRYEIRLRFGLLEGVLVLQYVCLAQAFMRNPVGLSILGSDTVGGRPYFEIAITFFVFLVLAAQVVDIKKVRSASRMFLFGSMGSAALEVMGMLIPGVGYYVARFYQLGSASAIIAARNVEVGYGRVNEMSVGRREYLSYIVRPLFPWLLAVTRPLGLVNMRRPFVVLGFLIVVLAVLFSGFRSLLIWIGMMYVAAAIVRRKKKDIVAALVGGTLLFCVLIGGNGQIFDLPLPVQRSLSFLPGNWDPLAEGDADSSVEWRVEMWKEVLTTDRYIENKIIGDGFGFSMGDLQFQAQMYTSEVLTPEMMQEHFLRSGRYHSGPIQTVNRVGYLGLIILTAGLFFFAHYAFRMIRRAEGTGYYVYSIFIGLPMVVYPFFFYLIDGGYQQAIGMMTFSGGMLRLIENSMDKYNVVKPDAIEENDA